MHTMNSMVQNIKDGSCPLVLVDGFRFEVALRAVAVAVDTTACTQLFHELRGKGFVQFFGDVAQSVLQCRSRLRRGKGVATVGCPPDALDKGRIGRQCFT